ncbi:conserved hypothetical protein, partial [Ricinus communis]
MAVLIFCVSCSRVRCLSIFGLDFLHAQPAFLDRRQQRGDLVDDGRVEADAGRVQAAGAVLVQAPQVVHHLAAVVEVQRARQAVDDVGALVQAIGLELVTLADDMAARARQLLEQAVGEHQHQLNRRRPGDLGVQIGGVITAVAFLVHHGLSPYCVKITGCCLAAAVRREHRGEHVRRRGHRRLQLLQRGELRQVALVGAVELVFQRRLAVGQVILQLVVLAAALDDEAAGGGGPGRGQLVHRAQHAAVDADAGAAEHLVQAIRIGGDGLVQPVGVQRQRAVLVAGDAVPDQRLAVADAAHDAAEAVAQIGHAGVVVEGGVLR